MKKVGIVGWRGMVGSVLMERMRQEGDFQGYEPRFFSTSQAGQAGSASSSASAAYRPWAGCIQVLCAFSGIR